MSCLLSIQCMFMVCLTSSFFFFVYFFFEGFLIESPDGVNNNRNKKNAKEVCPNYIET